MMAKPGDKAGTCGCGRSPTGNCIGWHALSEEEYWAKLAQFELAGFREDAEEIWFNSGSYTVGKSE